MRTPPRRRPARGFSLTEILVTAVILGLIASIVVPMLGDTSTTRLRSAAEMLAADLAFTQSESVAHGDDLRVLVFDTVAGSYRIAATSDTATPIENPVGKTPYVTTYGVGRAGHLDGVGIQSVSVGGDDILGYQIYGNLDQATDATITLVAGGRTITVTVDASTGEASIGSMS